MRRRDPEQQQVCEVYQALGRGDHAALQELAYAPLGFCSSELRRAVWLFLLGLSASEAVDASWRRHLAGLGEDSQDARVMQADVQRSVYSWDVHTGLRKTTRDQKRIQLSEVMHATLGRHKERLAYFQGFHDIVLVFLEVGTPAQAFHMVERLALFHLSDQLCCAFDRGLIPLLGVLFHLLSLLDAPLAAALEEAECDQLHFAVPWVLTWFAHLLPQLHQQVMRLFDCLLCSHPAAVLYFSAALLMQHREELLQAPRELPEMVEAVQGLPLRGMDVDLWAQRARELMLQVTPEELLARLPPPRRRALPCTSPLLHYPHPWMREPGALAVCLSNGDMSRLAPVYAGPAPLALDGRGPGSARLLLRALGVGLRGRGGGLLATALALLLRALGLGGTLALSARAWAKRR